MSRWRTSSRKQIPKHDLKLIISEIGLTPDWSSAYTPNSGTQDALMKIQLTEHRTKSAQEYVRLLRKGFADDRRFSDLEFAFDSGGLVRGALNEGKSTPINIQVKGKNQKVLHALAETIRNDVKHVNGIVDARVIQRLDAPELMVEVDRAKAAQLGLTQDEVMKNVIAATNSSITYNKKNFWIDPISHNQYFVGVQYPERKLNTTDDLLNIPIVTSHQKQPIPLGQVASIVPQAGADGNPPRRHHAGHRSDDERRGTRPGPRLRRGHQAPEQVRRQDQPGPLAPLRSAWRWQETADRCRDRPVG